MKQRVTAITLGCDDLDRARTFYAALGWEPKADLGEEGPIFYQAGTTAFCLWGRDDLAKDSGVENTSGFGGVTLACNVGSPEEVDAIIDEARAAGATITREPDKAFWGGYNAAFVDPEGHPWEVVYNHEWTITEDGGVTL